MKRSRQQAAPAAAPVNVASATGLELAHEFTTDQADTVQSLITQMREIESHLNFFMNHCVRAAKLPVGEGLAYRLAPNLKGLVRV